MSLSEQVGGDSHLYLFVVTVLECNFMLRPCESELICDRDVVLCCISGQIKANQKLLFDSVRDKNVYIDIKIKR